MQLNVDMANEDPYCTVVTHPCGPWSKWSQFNLTKGGKAAETVEAAREHARPLLKQDNKMVCGRLSADRHVFLEHPADSLAWEQPEMDGILRHLESGKLMYIRCDGCALGYRDRETGLPYRKPMGIVTSMISTVSILGNLRCQGCQHQQLEGNNKYGTRTAQAAEWPEEFDKLVADVIAQQVLIDEAEDSIEAFPLGVVAELPGTEADPRTFGPETP